MPEKAKIRNMGLKSGHFGRVTQNDALGYACETEVFELPELISSAGEFSLTDILIESDDAIYYKGRRLESGTLTLTVAELEKALYAELSGSEYDETENASDIATFEKSPELWFGAASEQLEAGFDIVQLFCCRCTGINNLTRQTKGPSNATGQNVEITLDFTKRKTDNKPGRQYGSQPTIALSATPPAPVPAP